MTKAWGPLGWATLHTIAALYPDFPSQFELELLNRFLASFTNTILCPSCLQHFAEMVELYTRRYPSWKNSRRTVCEFVFRAHNTVNKRNHKKIYTLEESIAELQTLFPDSETAKVRRQQYLVYIRNDWMKNMTLTGVSAAPKLKELNAIEEEYWARRSFSWSDIRAFGELNVSPINEQASVLAAGGMIVPKITMPQTGGFKLGSIGKIGARSTLR
jgi:hypothetical protein